MSPPVADSFYLDPLNRPQNINNDNDLLAFLLVSFSFFFFFLLMFLYDIHILVIEKEHIFVSMSPLVRATSEQGLREHHDSNRETCTLTLVAAWPAESCRP